MSVRHSKRKGIWGGQPSRSAELAAAVTADPDPARKAPAVKDTRNWCKGKPGREHKPEIILTHLGTCRSGMCKWLARHDYRLIRQGRDDEATTIGWGCYHEERCSECGKVLRNSWELRPAECPAYPGTPDQKAEAEREAADYPDRWRARARPRQVITGPQHYQKNRAS